MGILNSTPDSFYHKSRIESEQETLSQVSEMVSQGVDILDIGGYSTRPGAEDVSIETELERVLPAIDLVKNHFPDLPISIDTFRQKVAEQAIKAGATLVNDISGGSLDAEMHDWIATAKVPYMLMHSRGTPKTMTSLSTYGNVVQEVLAFLQQKIYILRQKGAIDIIADLGFGFAKTIPQNFTLLRNFNVFKALEVPLAAGISRKSMIWKTLHTSPDDALIGTSALHMIALQNGANLLRVHDVKEAKQVIKIYQRICFQE